MGEDTSKAYISFEEYEALEEKSVERHEWLDGVIRQRPESTIEHASISTTILILLANQLEEEPCVVFGPDLVVRVVATGLAAYPDLGVLRGHAERDPQSRTAVTNPTVLVEIFSEETEAYDRGEKFAHYRRIPSLREYVLVGQDQRRIEVFRKNDDGLWVLVTEANAGESATLTSIGCTLHVDEVYANVHMDSE